MKIQFLKDELYRLKKLDEHHGTIAQVFWRSLTEYRGRHIREIVKAWLTLRIKELEVKAGQGQDFKIVFCGDLTIEKKERMLTKTSK